MLGNVEVKLVLSVSVLEDVVGVEVERVLDDVVLVLANGVLVVVGLSITGELLVEPVVGAKLVLPMIGVDVKVVVTELDVPPKHVIS